MLPPPSPDTVEGAHVVQSASLRLGSHSLLPPTAELPLSPPPAGISGGTRSAAEEAGRARLAGAKAELVSVTSSLRNATTQLADARAMLARKKQELQTRKAKVRA